MNYINPIMASVLILVAALCFKLGFQWIYVGEGLHPLVSFTGGIFLILIALILMFSEDVSEKEWEI